MAFNINSEKHKVTRRGFAQVLLDLLVKGVIVWNFDETLIQFTSYKNKSWFLKRQSNFKTSSKKITNLGLIAGVNQLGDILYAFSSGTTTNEMI